jgi:hypothetical protein
MVIYMKKNPMFILIGILILIFIFQDIFYDKAHCSLYVENITNTEYDSLHPHSIKTKDGYIVFWEEHVSKKTTDILSMTLNEEGEPISEIHNMTQNDDSASFISSVLAIDDTIYILSKTVVTQNDTVVGANYYYELYLYNQDEDKIEITKKFIYNASNLNHFDKPSLVFDGVHLVMLYTKDIPHIYFTSNLYVQKYSKDGDMVGDEVFINFLEADEALTNLTLVDKEQEGKIIDEEFTIRTEEKDDREISGEDELKVQPQIYYQSGKYYIFFRAKTHQTHEEGLYVISMEHDLSSFTKPSIISTKEYNAYNYRLHHDKDNQAFFVLWEDYKSYYHKYISPSEAIYRRIEKQYKSKYISNIVKSGKSYFYTRIVDEFGKRRMLMERANIFDLDYDKDIRIAIFEEKPETPFMVSYDDSPVNTGLYGEPLKDYDNLKKTISVFWSEEIDDVYQIMFHKLNF